jgi:hypothetical protein
MSTLSDTCCLNRYSGASADDGWQKQREMPGRNRLIDKSLYCVCTVGLCGAGLCGAAAAHGTCLGLQ